MTDSTKNLFDAPWYVFSSPDDEITVIENESGRILAELDDVKTANRLANLPELYDALVCASFEYCKRCTKSFSSPDSFLSAGCAGKDGFCPAVFWWETLRKVRAGK